MTRRDDAFSDDMPHDDAPGDAPDDEALDVLRAAFDALPAPAPVRALSDEDETTQRTVAWMGAAWRALPVPEAPVPTAADMPLAAVTSLDAVRARRRNVLRVAAAAALVVAAIGLAWLAADRTDPATGTPDGLAHAPQDDKGVESPAGLPAPTEAPGARPLVAATSDRFELTSGPVRLVLFTDIPDPTRETPR